MEEDKNEIVNDEEQIETSANTLSVMEVKHEE